MFLQNPGDLFFKTGNVRDRIASRLSEIGPAASVAVDQTCDFFDDRPGVEPGCQVLRYG